MTFPTDPSYTAQALRTESPITPALQTRLQQHARLVHAVLGLQTEAGELADPVKKHIYYGRPLDLVNLREEIGDCLWYLAIAADALGTTLEAEQARNLAKLRARYPHVFTAEAAQVRDLDRERQVLEEDVADNPHTLRQQLAATRAESVAMRKQLDEAFKLIADVNTAGLQLWDKLQIANKAAAELIVERHAARAEIESLRKELANAQRELSEQGQAHSVETQQETADLRQQLDAARAEIETLQGAMVADDKRLRAAEERVWPGVTWGCDAPDKMADEILHLRHLRNVAEGEAVVVRKWMNDETDRHNKTKAEKVDLFQKLELANKHCSELVKARDAAHMTILAQRAGIERLQAFVAEVRQARDDYQWPDSWDAILGALAELDACTEPTEPTPVAEPSPCPECERLRVELETANEHRTDLVLFVDTVRKCFRVWGSDDTFIHSVSHALSELDKSNPSVTLTSSTPTPVAKPVDADGGQ